MSSGNGGGRPSKRGGRLDVSESGANAPASDGAPRQRLASHAPLESGRFSDDAKSEKFTPAELGCEDEDKTGKKTRYSPQRLSSKAASSFFACLESKRVKKAVSFTMGLLVLLLVADEIFAPPDKRLVNPSTFSKFLAWVQTHPKKGLAAFVVVYAFTVVCLLPGTPLTIGSGYIYKAAYGWGVGITIGSVFSTLGSLLGSVSCFLLGRYLMRDRVQIWVRSYPMFDALNAAVAEKGFKIMALLYLTPVLPLGPVSYMIGTTSMSLSHFAAAKIACLPLMTFYVFLGASTGTIIHGKTKNTDAGSDTGSLPEGDLPEMVVEGESTSMIVFGVCLSVVSVALISHVVKKELMKILDKQKAEGEKSDKSFKKSSSHKVPVHHNTDDAIDMKDATNAMRQRNKPLSVSNADDSAAEEDLGKDGHLA
uniref:VTT domain-containing protein n=1 Tax=Odontella aurita TaxID=265563 RepID=A0A7S4N5N1_9STRA|mmetsp:Transcript_48113/g.145325  ORF Transcript_48113/g.145325 Transcript_48113/m.145325 type:complete len:423 (+) Transcript_48113:135-1403(+)